MLPTAIVLEYKDLMEGTLATDRLAEGQAFQCTRTMVLTIPEAKRFTAQTNMWLKGRTINNDMEGLIYTCSGRQWRDLSFTLLVAQKKGTRKQGRQYKHMRVDLVSYNTALFFSQMTTPGQEANCNSNSLFISNIPQNFQGLPTNHAQAN